MRELYRILPRPRSFSLLRTFLFIIVVGATLPLSAQNDACPNIEVDILGEGCFGFDLLNPGSVYVSALSIRVLTPGASLRCGSGDFFFRAESFGGGAEWNITSNQSVADILRGCFNTGSPELTVVASFLRGASDTICHDTLLLDAPARVSECLEVRGMYLFMQPLPNAEGPTRQAGVSLSRPIG